MSRIVRPIRALARRIREGFALQNSGARFDATPIDLESPAVARDPFPHYESLRPAGRVQYLARHDAWIVLGYREVQEAFARTSHFSNEPYCDLDSVLLGADPPRHTDVRRVVLQFFDAAPLRRISETVSKVADSLIANEMDVVSGFGEPIGQAAAMEILSTSVPPGETFDDVPAFASLVESGLTPQDARSVIRLLWLAGSKTNERVIARCVLRLLQHDEVRSAVTADPSLVPAFVDEVIRLDPPEHTLRRRTTSAVELGGQPIPANALVLLSLGAANRDPDVFSDSAAMRLDRTQRHFGFGSGAHHCIGSAVGRSVVEIAIRTLLRRAPSFRAAQPLTNLVGWWSMTENPISSLRIITGVQA